MLNLSSKLWNEFYFPYLVVCLIFCLGLNKGSWSKMSYFEAFCNKNAIYIRFYLPSWKWENCTDRSFRYRTNSCIFTSSRWFILLLWSFTFLTEFGSHIFSKAKFFVVSSSQFIGYSVFRYQPLNWRCFKQIYIQIK